MPFLLKNIYLDTKTVFEVQRVKLQLITYNSNKDLSDQFLDSHRGIKHGVAERVYDIFYIKNIFLYRLL